MASLNPNDYRVRPGKKVHLKRWPTRVKAPFKSKVQYRNQLEAHKKELDALQRLLYASNQYALLLIFQAMDAAGKDGAIRHVMAGVNPQGCQVFSFNHPSAEELDHDFLWRTTCRLPERGRIGIFNRSYYEEVLIVRVHREILEAQGVQGGESGAGPLAPRRLNAGDRYGSARFALTRCRYRRAMGCRAVALTETRRGA